MPSGKYQLRSRVLFLWFLFLTLGRVDVASRSVDAWARRPRSPLEWHLGAQLPNISGGVTLLVAERVLDDFSPHCESLDWEKKRHTTYG